MISGTTFQTVSLKRRGGASAILAKGSSFKPKIFLPVSLGKEASIPDSPTSAILKKNSGSLKQLCDYFTGRRSQESRPPTLHAFCFSGRGCSWQLDTTHYTLHTIHYTLHTLHYTLHTLHYSLHTIHYTLHTIHYTLHTIHCTLYTIHCTLYTAHYTIYTLPYALYTVQCTL